MRTRTRNALGAALLALGLAAAALLATREDREVAALVARNLAARGGAEAWEAVGSLRLTGEMEVGQGLLVPYVLEQKRPDKMCLEFEFGGETAVQCTDGQAGWKLEPFRGRPTPTPLSQDELREVVDLADPFGLLHDYARRGHEVDLVGREVVDGREVVKLEVTLPSGAVRWVYLDAETALEVKVEARRTLAGRQRLVETVFHEWKATDGLLVARRQETRTEGEKASHALTVATVRVNPPIDDARFALPR